MHYFIWIIPILIFDGSRNSTYKTSEKDVENFKIKFSKKKKLIYLNIVIKNLG